MRVPNPAAGMITTTFIAGCKYTAQGAQVQMFTQVVVLSISNITVMRSEAAAQSKSLPEHSRGDPYKLHSSRPYQEQRLPLPISCRGPSTPSSHSQANG